DGASARPGSEEAEEREELMREADLEIGAPPEDLGRSDDTLAHSPMKEGDEEDLEKLDDYDFEDEEQPLEPEPAASGPRGVRGGRRTEGDTPDGHRHGRLVAFLIAVWAELKRVQWPDRKQLTQMTGIVLFFVLIAGGYLGLLDAVFSRIIKQIL
ncbi:MAG: preprotein translocase subunit SecE, partial [Thermoleophilaceae bacterium]|nr:preprotein translocase subunit SecE [Thermoleophilaceae bacterium]